MYIPVRRLALFLEQSIVAGTQWAIFEPNNEALWSEIRLAVGAFLQGQFEAGAFVGGIPSQAYFVKCDAATTTSADIQNGVFNIIVGFAPIRPAEFVILRLQQNAAAA